MKKISTLFFCFIVSICFGQTAEELNQQAKELLSEHDYKLAVPKLKQAAEEGNAEAQYNYGICFQQGVGGVPANDSIANEWFMKAAEQGYKDAEFKMSYSYATGRGCQKSPEQAFYWSIKCAEQNDPECMFNVVSSYKEGFGTQQSTDSMLVWAVKLGSLPDIENLSLSGYITSARVNLAVMYKEGKDVKKDLVASYEWYLIYNESKRDFSILVQQKNIDDIKEIEKSLTAKEKEAAKQNAEKQIGRRLKNLDNLYKTDI